MNTFIEFGTTSFFRKAGLVLLVLAMAATSWFAVRRTLGVTVAANATSKEIADIAIELAPDSPLAHFAAGMLLDKTFMPDDAERSQVELETAVSLSPADFRLWVELARSYEKNGQEEKAERAFRRALELAPNYSRVQWAVGNYMLRNGRSEDAFALISEAADREFALADAAAAVAWNIYAGDLSVIETYFAGSENLRAGLVAHLAGQGRFDDAIRIWSALPADSRTGRFGRTHETVVRKLLDTKRYLRVLDMYELAGRGGRVPGTVDNGDFEGEIKLVDTEPFAWRFGEGSDAQIGIDDQQVRGGIRQRTLTILFNSDGRNFRGLAQLIPASPERRYEFSVYYRSDIKNRATMRWEVVNTTDSSVLAATDPVTETGDWTRQTAAFTVPAGSEGVEVRLVRTGCLSTICPIAGKVWFDDVSLRETVN
jgi:tetratricopeptide (TPR) repeat protein